MFAPTSAVGEVQVCLQLEMVLRAGDRSVEEAVVRERAYLGIHGRWQIVDVAQEQDGTQRCALGNAGVDR